MIHCRTPSGRQTAEYEQGMPKGFTGDRPSSTSTFCGSRCGTLPFRCWNSRMTPLPPRPRFAAMAGPFCLVQPRSAIVRRNRLSTGHFKVAPAYYNCQRLLEWSADVAAFLDPPYQEAQAAVTTRTRRCGSQTVGWIGCSNL